MALQDSIFQKISEALLMDYSSVYYINAVTNEYYWYSVNPEFHSLKLEQGGDDFFKNIIRDCKQVIYEEDQHIFIEDIQKEKLLNDMKKGSMQNIDYRLIINGVPTWHSLRMIRSLENNSDYIILGVINIDEEYKRREAEKETAHMKEIYNQVTASLAERFDTLYYINIENGNYIEISSNDEHKKLNVPASGVDFFAESRRNVRKHVHPEDQELVLKTLYKDAMLENLKHRNVYSVTFRLIVDNKLRYIRHTELMAKDRKHVIVCSENIDEEVKENRKLEESRQKSITYTQIAESLASHYDMIYYVNVQTSYYKEFSTHKLYGELEIQEEGEDFFTVACKNTDFLIHPEDRARIKLFLDKDYLLSQLETSRQLTEDYRMIMDGKEAQYTRMTVRWSSDKTHFIICIENREDYVKKEKEHLQAISLANEIARRDSLTGTRNITAFHEYEKELQNLIDGKEDSSFGIIMCDLNNLKVINDTQGHKAGDEYIKNACKLICRIFHTVLYSESEAMNLRS